MTVTAVTPADAASAMSHPDHDRWVKEQTLAMEVAHHVGVLGGTLRDAEDANDASLQRMEARERLAKPVHVPSSRPTAERRAAMQGVTMRAPRKLITHLKPSPCGRCGTCRNCMRERRVVAISHKATVGGDRDLLALMWPFAMLAVEAQNRTGKFRGMRSRDIDRIVSAAAETLCDRTVRLMGEWR